MVSHLPFWYLFRVASFGAACCANSDRVQLSAVRGHRWSSELSAESRLDRVAAGRFGASSGEKIGFASSSRGGIGRGLRGERGGGVGERTGLRVGGVSASVGRPAVLGAARSRGLGVASSLGSLGPTRGLGSLEVASFGAAEIARSTGLRSSLGDSHRRASDSFGRNAGTTRVGERRIGPGPLDSLGMSHRPVVGWGLSVSAVGSRGLGNPLGHRGSALGALIERDRLRTAQLLERPALGVVGRRGPGLRRMSSLLRRSPQRVTRCSRQASATVARARSRGGPACAQPGARRRRPATSRSSGGGGSGRGSSGGRSSGGDGGSSPGGGAGDASILAAGPHALARWAVVR